MWSIVVFTMEWAECKDFLRDNSKCNGEVFVQREPSYFHARRMSIADAWVGEGAVQLGVVL
jgi:hypothetical protein